MPWFSYRKISTGAMMPYVSSFFTYGETATFEIGCLVDTGAAHSIAPKDLIASIYPRIIEYADEDAGMEDVHGCRIKGVRLAVDIHTRGLPPIRETVVFCDSVDMTLLGQNWLEKIGAHFRNFPFRGIPGRFALYDPREPYVLSPRIVGIKRGK